MLDEINVSVDYFGHIKTRRLVARLGKGADLLPLRMWCYCGKHHKKDKGRLNGYEPSEFEAVVLEWWGKPGDAIKALIDVGFLEKTATGYLVHNWEDRNGHLDALHERAKKAARARWDKIKGCSSIASSNAQALLKQCPNELSIKKPLPLDSPTSLRVLDVTTEHPEATGLRPGEDQHHGEPPEQPDMDLIAEVQEFIGGQDSRAYLQKVAAMYGNALLRLAYGDLKIRVRDGGVHNRGAYFVDLVGKLTAARPSCGALR